ncbi:MAG: type 2 isopentenyl-diphosphate Delta-isomerase, partial [Candidatus Diapherotrites archaeon]
MNKKKKLTDFAGKWKGSKKETDKIFSEITKEREKSKFRGTQKRKTEHIKISLKKNVQFRNKTNGFEDIELVYDALPNVNKKELSLKTEFFGKKFSAPIMIAAMTGGTPKAKKINKDIAKACEEIGIGMGLGSQRAMLEDASLTSTYQVRDIAPNIFLAGNLGAMQLNEFPAKKIDSALNEIGADALALHINAGQEAMQFEGDTNFRNALNSIKKLKKELKHEFFVKEVGCGINEKTAKELQKLKIKAIDVGGAGGTSWIGLDSLRGKGDLGKIYWDFGIPTSASIILTRKHFKG